jgi:hypothetical protein
MSFPGSVRAEIAVTLRDYFATDAMHAELLTCGVPGKACDALVSAASKEGRTIEEQIAWNAYEMADAMIAARSRTAR